MSPHSILPSKTVTVLSRQPRTPLQPSHSDFCRTVTQILCPIAAFPLELLPHCLVNQVSPSGLSTQPFITFFHESRVPFQPSHTKFYRCCPGNPVPHFCSNSCPSPPPPLSRARASVSLRFIASSFIPAYVMVGERPQSSFIHQRPNARMRCKQPSHSIS